MRVARRAGSHTATNATTVNSTGTTTNTTGSHDFTPNRKLDMKRVSPNAAPTPITTPINASDMPWKITIFLTSPLSAPRAMRMPISCVRCSTE